MWVRSALLAVAVWLSVWLSSCARDVQLCDAEKLRRKTLEGLAVCQAKGYEWLTCPDRPRILEELRKELGQCSN